MPSEYVQTRQAYRAPSVHTEISENNEDIRTRQHDSYQALLSPVAAPNDIDETMADFPWQLAETTAVSQDAPTKIKVEDADANLAWSSMQNYTIELSDGEDDVDSDLEILDVVDKPRQVIDLSTTENERQVRVKQEPDDSELATTHAANHFDLSDDEEDIVVLGDATNPPIKQEDQDVAFLWAEMPDGVIELPDSDEESAAPLTASLGHSSLQMSKSRPRCPTVDAERMRQIQRLYAARAKEGRRAVGGASCVFSIPQAPVNGRSGNTFTNDTSNDWMHATLKDDDDSVSNFPRAKRIYKAKKRAGKNTLQDDIAFKKAQVTEKARLKRLEAKFRESQYSIYSDDEAVESDDGLFIPENGPRVSSKRTNPATAETEDEEGTPATRKTGPKRQKAQKHSKRTRAELEEEEIANLMAGWEERGLKKDKEDSEDDTKTRKEATKDAKKTGGNKIQKVKGKKGKVAEPNSRYTDDLMAGKQPGKRRTKKPARNIVDSLTTGNVYEAANRNLKKTAIPVLTGSRKHDAMARLIAEVPLDETKKAQAKSDKNNILAATKILQNCSVYRKKAYIEGGEQVDTSKRDGETGMTQVEDTQEEGGAWALKGMTSALFHHQVQGAAKMKERENGPSEPFGGILADAMGFGKTVMVIATLIANPPGPEEEHRSTLIICSPAVINQWDHEIGKHTEENTFHEIIKHHGINRLSNKGASGRHAVSKMERADIVLSTYSELVKSYPKCHIPGDIKDAPESVHFEWWKKEWDTKRDMLHRAHFYRVILDEAHVIKNHTCYTSIACRALMAKHRWAVSGTPIHNSIEELYPYFKFLRIPFTSSYGIFRHNYCKEGSKVYNQRLHTYLDQVMIRRTHDDELLGAAIFKLPENHQETIMLEFNPVERHIYNIIRKRCVIAINRANKEEKLEERARLVLAMFQRLRQLTSHLLMLQETMERFLTVEDFECLWKMTKSEVTPNSRAANDMRDALKTMLAHKDDPPEVDMDPENVTLTQKEARDDDAIIFRFRKYLRTLKKGKDWAGLRARSTCNKCGAPADDPHVTECMHLYCAECLRAIICEAAQENKQSAKCLACDEVFTASRPCTGLKELEADDIPLEGQEKTDDGKNKRPHRTAKDNMKWCNLGGQILPSTKTAAVQIQVEKWLKDFPQNKIIVFSQFHLSMLVMGKLFEKKGWKYCTYHGQMSHPKREEAVETFGKDPEVKIMIASLKCGGIGLNLTMATRVICIDLWFNSCIEQQAFCRVFRIGQKEKTFLTRFVVRNTVDEVLMKMQSRKDKVIGAAMDDRTVLSSLSTDELMGLFGEVGKDEDNTPFIYAEEHPELAAFMQDPKDGEDPVAWRP